MSGNPVTGSGTLAISLPNRDANAVFAGPTTGSAAAPSFRSLVAADIPNIAATKITSGQNPSAVTFDTANLTGFSNAVEARLLVELPTDDGVLDIAQESTLIGLSDDIDAIEARSITAGTGLTGGGTLAASRTLAVDFAASGTSSSSKAVRADDSRLSDNRTPTSHVHSAADITSGSLDAARIEANSLSLGKLATIASGRLLGNASGTTGSVSALTVTSPLAIDTSTGSLKINSVSTSELSDGSVTTAKVADTGITEAKIANAAVTTAKIADAAVTMAKIAQSGATTNQVIKWDGTAWAPADDAAGSGSEGGAPTDAEYLTKSSSGGLSAERVVGDSTSVTANWATSGQVSFERAALTGDVTASANSNSTTIANNAITTNKISNGAVTFEKLQNITGPSIFGKSGTLSGSPESIGLAASLGIDGSKNLGITDSGVTEGKIATGAVTFAKIEELTGDSLLGNPTGSKGVMSSITCTAAGRALLDDADAAAQRTTLGAAAASHTHTATDSYVGHIETAANKTYRIDMYAATARTITDIRVQCGSGSCSAAIKNGSNTVGTVSVSTTSGGSSPSLSNTSVSANGTITLEISSNSDATDVWFVIRYTETI